MCSRNTVRESSHISFFCSGDPFCEVVRRLENTHEELTGLLEWPAGLSFRLRDQRTAPISSSDHWISTFSPNLKTLYCLFKYHVKVWTSSSPQVFLCLRWLYTFSGNFFDLIWKRKYLSLYPLAMNHILFSVKPLSWCYLATAFIYFVLTCVYFSSMLLSSAQGFVNGLFNETWTHSCLQFEWFFSWLWVYMELSPLFFFECVCLYLLYPSLVFGIWYVLLLCVCIAIVWISLTVIFLCVCVCVCECVLRYLCVCMCGSVVWNLHVIIFD